MKKIMLIIFVFLFCISASLSAGKLSDDVFIVNKTDKTLEVTFEFSDNIRLVPSIFGGGLTDPRIYYKDINNMYILFQFTEGYNLALQEGEEFLFYFYHTYVPWEELFSSFGPYKQFKIMFKKFTVTDETGTELITIDTLRPEHFLQTHNVVWCLVIE